MDKEGAKKHQDLTDWWMNNVIDLVALGTVAAIGTHVGLEPSILLSLQTMNFKTFAQMPMFN